MDEPNVPDPLAQMDQALRGMVDFGKFVKGAYDGFIENGFTAEQALYLTGQWMRQGMKQAPESGE